MNSSVVINEWLDGSPYLIPVDADGEARAGALLEDQVSIRMRQGTVTSAFREQADELQEELDRDFDLRLIFESNAIEGVTASFAETRDFLTTAGEDFLPTYSFSRGVLADPKLLEVVGHGRALAFVKQLAGDLAGRGLAEADIRNVHALAMAAEPRIAGQYKTMDNSISGRAVGYLTARADDVGWHVSQLVEWLNVTKLHGPLLAAVVSAWLADIHPFDDGNGRVSRLLANYVLFRNGWPCLIVRSGPDRQRYYEALASSDGGDIGPLFSLYVEGLHRSLSEMENPEFARTLLATDLERQNQYDSWSALHSRFTSCLQDELRKHQLELDVVGHIGPADFAWLSRRDSSGNGWWSKVRAPQRGIDVLLWFGFQSDYIAGASPRVRTPSVFISERDTRPVSLHPYCPIWEDERLSLHEVSLQPGASRQRAMARFGQEVRTVEMVDAAAALAESIAGLGHSIVS